MKLTQNELDMIQAMSLTEVRETIQTAKRILAASTDPVVKEIMALDLAALEPRRDEMEAAGRLGAALRAKHDAIWAAALSPKEVTA